MDINHATTLHDLSDPQIKDELLNMVEMSSPVFSFLVLEYSFWNILCLVSIDYVKNSFFLVFFFSIH